MKAINFKGIVAYPITEGTAAILEVEFNSSRRYNVYCPLAKRTFTWFEFIQEADFLSDEEIDFELQRERCDQFEASLRSIDVPVEGYLKKDTFKIKLENIEAAYDPIWYLADNTCFVPRFISEDCLEVDLYLYESLDDQLKAIIDILQGVFLKEDLSGILSHAPREIGEEFNIDGDFYKVVKGNTGCQNCCAFCRCLAGGCESPEEIAGACQNMFREDKLDVHFEKIRKDED